MTRQILWPRLVSPMRASLLVIALALLQSFHGADAETAGQHPAAHFTPLLLSVQSAPVPFSGSDGRTHLVYEVLLTNFSGGDGIVSQVEVLGDGKVIATLDQASVASRLQPFGSGTASTTMAGGTNALLYVHLKLAPGAAVPKLLSHRVAARFSAVPGPQQQFTLAGAEVSVAQRKPLVIGPPLAGERYVAADSCCDSRHHVRAALPVNGQIRIAQRFAVDWEQLDEQNRIFSGPLEALASYPIYGKEVFAVTDARVASAVDGLPEQIPGKLPAGLPLEQVNGNSVVLDLGGGNFAVYAHLQPRSLRVGAGDLVRRGQVLGLVGNSGNTTAPHLHFHVMDGPSPVNANGLPYQIDGFQVTGRTAGTDAFNDAELTGAPLQITPVTPPATVVNALPMDQVVIRFGR